LRLINREFGARFQLLTGPSSIEDGCSGTQADRPEGLTRVSAIPAENASGLSPHTFMKVDSRTFYGVAAVRAEPCFARCLTVKNSVF
jgi:hypothetical protein